MSVKTLPVHTRDIAELGIQRPGRITRNLSVPALVEQALARAEGRLVPSGALSCTTGKYTGRSPRDKFIVDDPEVHERIAWGAVNQPFSPSRFDRLYDRLMAYLGGRDLFVFDGFAGADPRYRVPVRIINELAWHNLFVRELFIRPSPEELASHVPSFTVICAPGFLADPETDGTRSEAFVIISFSQRVAIIGGTQYAGEMKKSIFTVLNYLLPLQDVLPMHCSANIGADGVVALFFGLSGTGKTTLSSDPERRLVGDDEHGWSDAGVFNFEGGCYAKTIRLRAESEPLIWNAIRFGSVLENVVIDPVTREVSWDDESLTENTRAAYPLDFIPGAVESGQAGHPKVVFFLAADAKGVLPPISRLNREQAVYHFLSGYTSKLGGTERDLQGIESTFSTLFGEPFFPLPPAEYARMLADRMDRHGTSVYLVNTGWTGGPYGVGRRIQLGYTRALIRAAIGGALEGVAVRQDPVFGVAVPEHCPGVPDTILNPRGTWSDAAAYDTTARELAADFRNNFARLPGAPREFVTGGPRIE